MGARNVDGRVGRGAIAGASLALLTVALGLSLGDRGAAGPALARLGLTFAPRSLAELRGSLAPESGALGVRRGIEDPAGHALDAFHAALRRAELGRGQAHVLFYGGSHTAGDHVTGRVREALQSYFGDAGHGTVNLVPIVTDQWRSGVVIDEAEGWTTLKVGLKAREVGRYGAFGAAFVSNEAGSFAAITSAPWGNAREASRLSLFYDHSPGAGALEVWIDGRRAEVLDTHASAPLGGHRVYEVSDTTHRLEVRSASDTPVRIFGAAFDRDAPGVRVDNLGLVGSKARHHLMWDEALFREQLVLRDPDLVVLAYGTNEAGDTHLTIAEHEAHFDAVLVRVRAAAPEASCVVVGPTDKPQRGAGGRLEPMQVIAELTTMQRRVALARGCGFFDTLAFQGGLGASLTWLAHDPPYMRDDLVHLSAPGYRRWGDELTRALLARYRGAR